MSGRDSKSHPIPFGRRTEGRLVPVQDVQRGAKCDCICPRCRRPLVARKGAIRAHHFAHAPGVRPCEGAAETALHLMAKQIIGEASLIEMPKMTVREPETTELGQSKPGEVQVCPKEAMAIKGSRLESTEDRFRPDVVVWDDRRIVWIEVKVTHHVSEYKQDELRKAGVGCVEIDLRHLNPQEVDLDELREVLLKGTRNKRWLTHPGEAPARAEARALWEQREEARREREARRSSQTSSRPVMPSIVSERQQRSHSKTPSVIGPPKCRWLVCPQCRHLGQLPYNSSEKGRRFRCSKCGTPVHAA